MKKKSNRGKGYFYAIGQRDRMADSAISVDLYISRKRKYQHLMGWCYLAWLTGYYGC